MSAPQANLFTILKENVPFSSKKSRLKKCSYSGFVNVTNKTSPPPQKNVVVASTKNLMFVFFTRVQKVVEICGFCA
jgi:hypothetical protein